MHVLIINYIYIKNLTVISAIVQGSPYGLTFYFDSDFNASYSCNSYLGCLSETIKSMANKKIEAPPNSTGEERN